MNLYNIPVMKPQRIQRANRPTASLNLYINNLLCFFIFQLYSLLIFQYCSHRVDRHDGWNGFLRTDVWSDSRRIFIVQPGLVWLDLASDVVSYIPRGEEWRHLSQESDTGLLRNCHLNVNRIESTLYKLRLSIHPSKLRQTTQWRRFLPSYI